MSTPDDLDHDAWLRHALRHAPDADAAPPAALSAAILAQAHAQSRSGTRSELHRDPAQPTPHAGGLARFMAAWRWLAQPPVAAGFASVLLATVVGVMWWGQPLEQALPGTDIATDTAASPEVQLSRRTTPADPGEVAVHAVPRVAEATPQPTTATASKISPSISPHTAPSNPPTSPPNTPRTGVAQRSLEPARQATAEAPVARQETAAAEPAAAPAVAAAESRMQAAAAPPAQDRATVTAKMSVGSARLEDAAAADSARSRRAADMTSAAAGATASMSPLASPAASPPASPPASANASANALQTGSPAVVRSALATAPGPRAAPAPVPGDWLAQPQRSLSRWSWQRDSGVRQPMSPALATWLAQLEATAGPTWVALPAPTRACEPRGEGLTIWRDELRYACVALEAELLRIDRLDPDSGQALASHAKALTAAQAQALRQALQQALQ